MSDQCKQLLTTRRIQDDYEIPAKRVRAACRAKEMAGQELNRKIYVERGEVERWIQANAHPVVKGRRPARGGRA